MEVVVVRLKPPYAYVPPLTMANQNLASIVRSSTREVFFFLFFSFYGPFLCSLHFSSLSEVHLWYLHDYFLCETANTYPVYKPVEGQQRDQSWAVRFLPPPHPPPICPSFFSIKSVSRTNSRCESVPFYVCPSSICAPIRPKQMTKIFTFLSLQTKRNKKGTARLLWLLQKRRRRSLIFTFISIFIPVAWLALSNYSQSLSEMDDLLALVLILSYSPFCAVARHLCGGYEGWLCSCVWTMQLLVLSTTCWPPHAASVPSFMFLPSTTSIQDGKGTFERIISAGQSIPSQLTHMLKSMYKYSRIPLKTKTTPHSIQCAIHSNAMEQGISV